MEFSLGFCFTDLSGMAWEISKMVISLEMERMDILTSSERLEEEERPGGMSRPGSGGTRFPPPCPPLGGGTFCPPALDMVHTDDGRPSPPKEEGRGGVALNQ